MELVEGRTLRSLIGRRSLPIQDALSIATQIAEGLARAHQAGVVHRDLKPDNVIVDRDQHPKILDFGLAKLLEQRDEVRRSKVSQAGTLTEEMTWEGKIPGTAAYMSPEQARGAAVDARSDIFSFGIMLYEMVTGRRPFSGGTRMDTLTAIIHVQAIPASRVNPDVSFRIESILDKCLRKSLADRYQHADDLVVDLREAEKSTESSGRPVAAGTGRLRRPIMRWWHLALAGVLAAAIAGFAAWNLAPRWEGLGGATDPPRLESLAVLPLENLSGDPEQEYFADGMTEALIAELSKIGALRIISRTSVMRYRETDKALPEIARELGVDAVVEGSVLRVGDRVRVTAQLIQAQLDTHLWSGKYDREFRDILGLHSDVARAITDEIKVAITPAEEARLARVRPVSPEAHEQYLKGQYHLNKGKWTSEDEGFKKAIEHFQEAIEIDPNHAQAYAVLAHSYGWLWFTGFLPAEEAYSRFNPPLRKALELDDTLPEAHLVLAQKRFLFEWDWAGAETEYRRTIELNPSYAYARSSYASYLMAVGRFPEAIAEAKRAIQLDPLSLPARYTLGYMYYNARQYDRAIAHWQQTAELEPNDFRSPWELARIYEEMGRYEDAVRSHQEAMILWGAPAEEIAALGRSYSISGPEGYLLWHLETMNRSYEIARIHELLGDKEQALAWLEKAYEKRDGPLFFLKVSPLWDPLRSDTRFQDVLRRMNFPE
jgi:TolB-like protein/Tfp pilus assembly protein PilF